MEKEFFQIAANARAAEAYRAECEEKFALARQWLEAAAREASRQRATLRAFVEGQAGVRL